MIERARLVPQFALPAYAFVPRRFPHPHSDPLGHRFGRDLPAAQVPDLEHWADSLHYLVGVDLFNHGYYWEAHEAWESVWNACGRRGPMATFLKAMIQWAVVGVKAREQCADLAKLQKVWLDTTPAEPSSVAWELCRAGISTDRAYISQPASPPRRSRFVVAALVAGAALFVGAVVGIWRFAPTDMDDHRAAVNVLKNETDEVFEVAQSHEITILRVEGSDTDSFVVGILPLVGALELADPGEVRVLFVRPEASDQSLPNVREQGRPMIWARNEVD